MATVSSARTRRSCRRRSRRQVWCTRRCGPLGEIKLHSADAGEAIHQGGEQIIIVNGPADCCGKNGADLRLHRSAMTSRADAQPLLHLIVQVSDSYSSHCHHLQVLSMLCLLYTSDAADDLTRVDLGGR